MNRVLEVRCCCDAGRVIGYVEIPEACVRAGYRHTFVLDDLSTLTLELVEVQLRRAYPNHESVRRWLAFNSDGHEDLAVRIAGLRPADGSTGNTTEGPANE